jgi:hypothetical protein
MFFKAMARIETKFIVKYDGDAPAEGFPKNVMPVAWISQQDVVGELIQAELYSVILLFKIKI